MNDVPEQHLTVLKTKDSDADFAKAIKARMETTLREACLIMDEASQRGLAVNFSLAKDQFNRNRIQDISVVKPL